ncbi:unnamed protein product [Gemmataceae bacterium]|nr:unnamed protein product [Gemmataceae bacterium]VTT98036.1 unnamed protein product [Gemmataceae bacterium]
MTRRTKIACLVAAGVVGIGLVLSVATSRAPVDIGLKDAAVGGAGMRTEAEVVARFGPPGDYATRKRYYEFVKMRGPQDLCRDEGWYDDFASVVIYFHNDGTVACWHRAMVKPPPPWHERFERFLRGMW